MKNVQVERMKVEMNVNFVQKHVSNALVQQQHAQYVMMAIICIKIHAIINVQREPTQILLL